MEEPKGAWPEDWRVKLAGGDEKELKQLGRYGSVQDIWKKSRELEKRLSSGELRPVLGKNATEDEVKAYRAANGIPESPEKYDVGTVPESAKVFMNPLLKAAHETNQTPEQVKATLAAWRSIEATVREQAFEKDQATKQASEDELREEWGPEYRRNIAAIENELDLTAEPGLKELILNGRTGDGTPFAADARVMRWLLGTALARNPAATVVPANGADPMKGIDERMGEIEKMMRTDRESYMKNDKVQAEYRQLIEAKQKLEERSR